MLALQRVLVAISLMKKILVNVTFAKNIGRCSLSKRVLVDDGLASASEVFTRK